jgi:hypothetical protein
VGLNRGKGFECIQAHSGNGAQQDAIIQQAAGFRGHELTRHQ